MYLCVKFEHFSANIASCQSVDHLVRASRFSWSHVWSSSVTISGYNLTSSTYNSYLVSASNILDTSLL